MGPAETTAGRARSADGTAIAYERVGEGPTLVVVGGALSDRASFQGLARRLSGRATVVCYDRRGRGESADRSPHRVADEVDDLRALCAAVGAPELLYGHSSGGLLALAAVAGGLEARRVCVYEPPFLAGQRTTVLPSAIGERFARLAAAGRRGEAVAAFLEQGTGMAPSEVAALREGPRWRTMEALAHTLAYDVALCVGPEAFGPAAAAAIEAATLVLAGGESRGTIRVAAEDLAGRLGRGELRVLAGEGHVVESAVIAPVLEAELGRVVRDARSR